MSIEATFSNQAARARVFISYKHAEPDQTLARQLAAALEQHCDVFIDQHIVAGTNWARQITAELERADFFIVLLSKLSIESEMVAAEIELARDLAAERGVKRPQILPVRVMYRERLPLPLNGYFRLVHWIDWDKPDDTPCVVAALLRAMALQPELATVPTLECAAAAVDTPAPAAAIVPSAEQAIPKYEWDVPKGAIRVDSPLYIERPADTVAETLIGRDGGVTITILGPRQIGKTSLLVRIADAAAARGKRVAWLDFQIFDSGSLADSSAFYRQLCAQISASLELEPRVDDLWNDGFGDNINCTRYIEQAILPQAAGPVVLAIDEADRIFASTFYKDFFGMLRSWHNKRAFSKLMRRLDMVLVASTEPQMYITDPLQSPFNVAAEIHLSDFSTEDVRALNARYWSPLDEDQLGRLTDLVGGHPFLTHYAIYAVATNSISAERFFATATLDGGLFDDHLKHLLLKLFSAPELIDCMREIVAGRPCRDDRAYYRLSGAGLVRRVGGLIVPRCRLYADFFRDRL